ncbi:MAG TPA: OsmC family protein [Chloroflexaceae bacterium]|mgnify:CR=1 FL=1|nr:OsmC family protein [Chloroflexaceae bacterium]
MAEFQRSATSTWRGDLKGGSGVVSTESGALTDTAITYVSRFENAGGSNPEELVGAAHAACYSMFLSAILSGAGHVPEAITTRAAVTLLAGEGGPKVTRVHLVTEGRVPGIDQATFQKFADDAKAGCPISKLLAPGLEGMTLEATLQ